ncbi:DUF2397 family protein [Streptosporangium roseum]|uniref:DUF2397 family protein n=1 Tax=Streptosporangium roseum TaxID=2001 RepID=UPI0033314412
MITEHHELKSVMDLEAAGYRLLVEAAAPQASLLDTRDQQYWIEERVRRLSDLAAWFEPDGTVQRLIASATGAVYTLLVAIDRRYAARRRGSDLGADFRSLASSLHRQPSDSDARRVYVAAFGDWPAWHAVVGVPVVIAENPTDIADQRRRGALGQGQRHPRPGPPHLPTGTPARGALTSGQVRGISVEFSAITTGTPKEVKALELTEELHGTGRFKARLLLTAGSGVEEPADSR